MKHLFLTLSILSLFLGAKAQLVINELSNGATGNQEYVELLVIGGTGCGACIDLRGWVIDDNNGTFNSAAGSGIATGHLRFANVAQWSCVPVGTLIVVYDEDDRNTSIPPDNTTGANCTYILPASSSLFDYNTTNPVQGGAATYGGALVTGGGGDWGNQLGLNNTNDSYQTRDPLALGSPYHAVSYGNNTTGTVIYFTGAGGGQVYSMTNGTSNDPFLQANWTQAAANATTQTPGAPNNTANGTWISTLNNNCTPGGSTTVTLAVSPNDTVCAGDTVILTATASVAGGIYTFSTGNVGAANSDTIIATGNTVLQVIYEAPGGCRDTAQVNLVVNSVAQVSAGPDRTVCVGTSVLLVATTTPGGATGNYLWSTTETNDSITVNPGTTTPYIVSFTTVPGGCVDRDTVVVNYNPNPVISAGPDALICNNDSAILVATATTAGTFTWNTGTVNDTLIVFPTDTTTYTVTFVDAATGCTASDPVTVFVNTNPTVTAGNDTAICFGGQAFLTANSLSAGSYSWSTGQNTRLDTVSPAILTVYTVTFINANGCTATDDMTVTVNALPTVDAGPPQTICAGNAATLTAVGSTTGNYQWAGGPATATYTVTPAGSTTYTVVFTDGNTCSATDSVRVTVNPSPPVSAGADAGICLNTSTTLTATGAQSYQWTGGPATATYLVSPLTTTTFTVTGTDANGCTATDAVVVTVNSLPTADAGPDQTICSGNSATLTATGGTQYAWSTIQTGATITVSPVADATYTVTVTDANGCQDTDDVDVLVNPAVTIVDVTETPLTCNNSGDGQVSVEIAGGTAPYTYTVTGQTPVTSSNTTEVFTGLPGGTYTVIVTDDNGCDATNTNNVVTEPAEVTFTANPTAPLCFGQDSGAITLDNSSLIYSVNGGAFSSTLSYTALTPGSYEIIGEDPNGCRDTNTVTITAPAQLTVDVTPDLATTIVEGETVALQSVTGGGTTPYSYVWTPTERLTCTDCPSPVASPLDTILYTLIVTDDNGCTATDSVLINVQTATRVLFPTAFTPGNGGKNNLFRPILNGELDAFKMMIFNRWGEKIFETTNYKEGWDGIYNGELQPIATYVFLVEYTPAGGSTNMIDKGNFTLLR